MIVKVMYSATPEIKALILDYNSVCVYIYIYRSVCVYVSNIAVDNQQGSYFLALISLLIKRIDATKP